MNYRVRVNGAVLGLAALLLACGQFSVVMETAVGNTEVAPVLATAHSDVPAAGICAPAVGDVVMVNVGPGPDRMPEVRCFQVSGVQRVRFVNRTDGVMEVMFGGFALRLEAGSEGMIDVPFGEYLAAGVHQVSFSEG
ncbi:MAG: hypothetical protein OEZ02_15300, partial [Anaerolineae bacterium]|nr:hypothetical protein [Anaerolineae bacterium]